MKNNLTLLGGLSVKEFLNDYWQKKPLLIRQAIPDFCGLLSPEQLIRLACTPDIQARLVSQNKGKWRVQQGIFEKSDLPKSTQTKWTLLVQGLNHTLPQAAELLKRFNFIPHTRLDDLMVSYAPKDGGVGPHFDSYDVFLLQGYGQRRWQISAQQDLSLVENAPLKILRNFTSEHEWVLEPGDMLYLPPHCAHNGIAVDDCMTYSIGFRAPSSQELAEQFLVYMQDNICLDGMYADPDLQSQTHPSEISNAMLQQVARTINQIQWEKSDIANFLGRYLSEPKPHIFFDPPDNPWSKSQFLQTVRLTGVALDLKTLMLCCKDTVFINGETYRTDEHSYKNLRILADNRHLDTLSGCSTTAIDLLYLWYSSGYIIQRSASENKQLE